jgi:hypothetical protein
MVQNSAEYQYGYEVSVNGTWHGQSGVYDWPGVVETCRSLGAAAEVRVYDRTGLFWQGLASLVPSEKPAVRASASVGAPVQTTATPPSAEGERPEQVVARLDSGEPAPGAPEPKATDMNNALSAPAREGADQGGSSEGTVGVPPAATPTQHSSGQPKKARLRVFSDYRTRDLAPSGLAYYCCLTGRRWAGKKRSR